MFWKIGSQYINPANIRRVEPVTGSPARLIVRYVDTDPFDVLDGQAAQDLLAHLERASNPKIYPQLAA